MSIDSGDTTSNALLAYNLLRSYLAANGWQAEVVERNVFRAEYHGNADTYICFFQIYIELQEFIFYAVPGFSVPSLQLAAAAEYITRVNYNMRIGNFELDLNDGEIRFKSSINFMGERLTQGYISGAVKPALEAVESYIPGLINVIEGRQSPLRAITSIDYRV